ncbi:MAG: TrmH family RNA methyltransferase [Nocardioidaceae bacterium]
MAAYDDRPPDDPPAEITSPANPQVKWLVALRKRRVRDAERVMLVEGYDELVLALEAGVTVRGVFCCLGLVRDESRLALLDTLQGGGSVVVRLGESAFAKASYRESPDGWLAVVANPERSLAALSLPASALVLVAESVEKPGNLGAMLRTADAAGVDAVVAASPVTDWGNPNVVRASKGTVFAVPVASAPTSHVIGWLREQGVRVVVASPEADTMLTDVDLCSAVAVVVGAEHAGVSEEWRAAADLTARIPMAGRVNSLNVSTSAAIVLFEAVRQRALSGSASGARGQT